MMTFRSLKTSILQSLYKLEDVSNENKIIIGCLTLSIIKDIINNDKKRNGQVSELADNYVATFKSVVQSLESSYVSYKEIITLINKLNIDNFMEITESQLLKILDLYSIKTKKQKFSTSYYSQYMYSILYISDTENNRMEKVHNNIINPIVNYFITYKGAMLSDVKVEPVDFINRNYSKDILIMINDINSAELYSAIVSDKFDIMKYLYSVVIRPDDYVELIIK